VDACAGARQSETDNVGVGTLPSLASHRGLASARRNGNASVLEAHPVRRGCHAADDTTRMLKQLHTLDLAARRASPPDRLNT
jgi:hypothetical protein